MMTADTSYDVLVIGGGPAGATVATLVAERGHRVLLAERVAEPGFKIGESLMPATYWPLQRLGLLERMKASAFPAKHSVQFFTKTGKATRPFYFFENDPHESSRTWQVRRGDFDQMMLENASEKGAEVRRGWSVQRVSFSDGRAVGAELSTANGDTVRVRSRVVVDASGQSAVIARALGLVQVEPRMRHVSYFSHFEGARRDSGIDEGATLILHTKEQDSWFWYIPLPNDVVSVGVVGPVDHLVQGRVGDPQKVFEEELALCPALQPRLEGARQLMPMRALRDFSYRSRQIAGDGWVLVGDAFGFVDPIYSSGVFLALQSGELAADAILDGLAKGDLSGEQLGRFGADYNAGVEAIRRLVYAFYTKGFSFAEFLRVHPHCRRDVVNLLIGNVYREPIGDLFERMGEMIELPEAAPYDPPAVAAGAPS